MNKHTIILSHPRAGTHLLGYIVSAKDLKAIDRPDGYGSPIPVHELIGLIEQYGSVWFHYPYDDVLAEYLSQSNANKKLLLRDPRDIIVSMAHYPDMYPHTFLNFSVNGNRLRDYPLKSRIDYLIDDLAELGLREHEKWRQSGLFELVYFSQLIRHPAARAYTRRKRRGIVGAHLLEMTSEQIEKSTDKFGDLIEKWKYKEVTA